MLRQLRIGSVWNLVTESLLLKTEFQFCLCLPFGSEWETVASFAIKIKYLLWEGPMRTVQPRIFSSHKPNHTRPISVWCTVEVNSDSIWVIGKITRWRNTFGGERCKVLSVQGTRFQPLQLSYFEVSHSWTCPESLGDNWDVCSILFWTISIN
jgi:hypothetical protein